MSTFDSAAFLSAVSGDGDWFDEFLTWYEPSKWRSEEWACAAFIAGKFEAARARQNECGSGAGCLYKDAVVDSLTEQLEALRSTAMGKEPTP